MARLKHKIYRELHRSDASGSSGLDAMMREVLHMLGNIDFQHEVELDRAETRTSDDALKEHIKKQIRAAHHERREPYVELLATLRQRQHRLAS
jgi:hypothetical protein